MSNEVSNKALWWQKTPIFILGIFIILAIILTFIFFIIDPNNYSHSIFNDPGALMLILLLIILPLTSLLSLIVALISFGFNIGSKLWRWINLIYGCIFLILFIIILFTGIRN